MDSTERGLKNTLVIAGSYALMTITVDSLGGIETYTDGNEHKLDAIGGASIALTSYYVGCLVSSVFCNKVYTKVGPRKLLIGAAALSVAVPLISLVIWLLYASPKGGGRVVASLVSALWVLGGLINGTTLNVFLYGQLVFLSRYQRMSNRAVYIGVLYIVQNIATFAAYASISVIVHSGKINQIHFAIGYEAAALLLAGVPVIWLCCKLSRHNNLEQVRKIPNSTSFSGFIVLIISFGVLIM